MENSNSFCIFSPFLTNKKRSARTPPPHFLPHISFYIFYSELCIHIYNIQHCTSSECAQKTKEVWGFFPIVHKSVLPLCHCIYSHRAFNMGILYKILPPLDPFSTFYRKIQKLRHCTVYRKNIYTHRTGALMEYKPFLHYTIAYRGKASAFYKEK